MKKISIVIVLALVLVLPATSHAMTLGDVLTQYNVYKQEAAANPSVLGASVGNAMDNTVPMPPERLPKEAPGVLLKALRYSEGSPIIIVKPIKSGMDKSDEVKKLQLFLIAKGYLNADPTGKYGPLTVKAVRKFQMEKGIKGDGTLVGPATRAAISTDVASATTDIQQ